MQINLKKIKGIHFTGIKGVGMTALALCAKDMGIKINGSDIAEKFVTDEVLKKSGIKYRIGFNKKNLKNPDLLIYTGAHQGRANPEVLAAKKLEIPTLSQAEALGLFMNGKKGISVCGVGGKTTASAMMATVLTEAGLEPSYVIGVGSIKPLGLPGRYEEKGKYFIAEADEYMTSPQIKKPRFNYQKPMMVIMTNIEFDHPDVYRNINETIEAFTAFAKKVPLGGILLAWGDNEHIKKMLKKIKVPYKTYGFGSNCDWQITKVVYGNKKTNFKVKYRNQEFKDFIISVPGRFNVLNATAVLAAGYFLGIKLDLLKKGLAAFKGSKRRFEFIKKIKGIELYDDYAHHPCEIKATLEAVKNWLPKKRVVVIFQPHTYSRTKYLLKDFSKSFSAADEVIITEIYASAREKNTLGVSGKILAQEIAKNQKVNYLPDCRSVCRWLRRNSRKGDVVFTLGAGSIFLWHQKIIKCLEKRKNNEK